MIAQQEAARATIRRLQEQNAVVWPAELLRTVSNRVRQLEALSQCRDKKVVCIYLTRKLDELAHGINGTCSDGTPCGSKKVGYNHCVHAEDHTSKVARERGIDPTGCIAWSSYSPCANCAKILVSDRVEILVFENIHRDATGIHYALSSGLRLYFYDGSELVEVPRSGTEDGHLTERRLRHPQGGSPQEGTRGLTAKQESLMKQMAYIQTHMKNLNDLNEQLKQLLPGSSASTELKQGRSVLQILSLIETEEYCLREAERGVLPAKHP